VHHPDGERVDVVEVGPGPGDGFQPIVLFIPTATKIAIIEALCRCGVTRMEIGSFVSAKLLPQIVRAVLAAAACLPQLEPAVLVPNLRGAELALEAGARHLVTVVSATESHNGSNTCRSIQASLDELRAILRLASHDGIVRYSVVMSFHCPFKGPMHGDRVLHIIANALAVRQDVRLASAIRPGKPCLTRCRRSSDGTWQNSRAAPGPFMDTTHSVSALRTCSPPMMSVCKFLTVQLRASAAVRSPLERAEMLRRRTSCTPSTD
jgi:hypothetical protein